MPANRIYESLGQKNYFLTWPELAETENELKSNHIEKIKFITEIKLLGIICKSQLKELDSFSSFFIRK